MQTEKKIEEEIDRKNKEKQIEQIIAFLDNISYGSYSIKYDKQAGILRNVIITAKIHIRFY